MTNLKKSYGIPVLAFLALAFCVLLIGQTAIAKSEGKQILEAIPIYDGDGVPLPGTDDVTILKKAVKTPRSEAPPVERLVELTSEQLAARRPLAHPTTLSVMQGGETYETATVIPSGSLPTSLVGTTEGYAFDYAHPCGYTAGTSPDVVYSYTPTVDEYVNFNMCESSYDTKLWVVEAAGMTVLACNDDGPDCLDYQSQIDIVAMGAGLTYYIVVSGYYWPGNAGPYQLDLALFIGGVDCIAAFPIEFDPGDGEDDDSQDYAVDLSGGGPNSSVGVPNCLFYQFTAEASGLFSFSWTADENVPLVNLTGLAGAIVCYYDRQDGNPPSPAAFALDYGTGPGPYLLQAVMMPGWTYTMEPFDWGEGQTGTLTISRQEMQALNDECTDAEDLGVGNVYSFVHNVNATLSSGYDFSFCDNLDPTQTCADVWYTWEADETGFVQFDMCEWGESVFDSKMFVYRGYTCTGTEVPDPYGCSDDGCGIHGDGGLVEMTCTAGEVFTIRLAGWYDPEGPCAASGMGTGYIDIWQTAESIRPYNDDCSNVVVGTLAPGGDVYTAPVNNLFNSGWASCPDGYNVPDASMGPCGAFQWWVWDAFEISECTDIRIDYCGTQNHDPGRVSYTNWPDGINIMTGCVCAGPMVIIPTSGGTYADICDPVLYPDDDYAYPNRGWDYPGLIPGTYIFPTSNWHLGINQVGQDYRAPYDFLVNVRGTPVECAYCEAMANVNTCPNIPEQTEVGNATWIKDVNLANLDKDGVPYVQHVSNDCNGYEDHTDMIVELYRGISYDFDMVFDKTGALSDLDICDVWADWNQNSGLCANQTELNERFTAESFITGTSPNYIFHFGVTMTPPLDAAGPGEGATGFTLMRVRLASTADGVNVACGEKTFGEVEDFVIEVSDIECGDFFGDGVGADDIEFLRDWYFGGTTEPDYWQRADIDGDGEITIADIIALVDAAYHEGDLICL